MFYEYIYLEQHASRNDKMIWDSRKKNKTKKRTSGWMSADSRKAEHGSKKISIAHHYSVETMRKGIDKGSILNNNPMV